MAFPVSMHMAGGEERERKERGKREEREERERRESELSGVTSSCRLGHVLPEGHIRPIKSVGLALPRQPQAGLEIQ